MPLVREENQTNLRVSEWTRGEPAAMLLMALVTDIIEIRVLDVLRPVNREGSYYQGETKCIPTTSKILIHNSIPIPLLRIGDI